MVTGQNTCAKVYNDQNVQHMPKMNQYFFVNLLNYESSESFTCIFWYRVLFYQ